MEYLENAAIEKVLKKQGRVYLCGKLEKENELDYLKNSGYEIGISNYTKYSFEMAHRHTFNKEYNYVLVGSIKVWILSEKKEYIFNQGDLFVIDVNEAYVCKSQKGTRVIFSKVPGGNDKELVPMDNSLLAWGKAWDSNYGEK